VLSTFHVLELYCSNIIIIIIIIVVIVIKLIRRYMQSLEMQMGADSLTPTLNPNPRLCRFEREISSLPQ